MRADGLYEKAPDCRLHRLAVRGSWVRAVREAAPGSGRTRTPRPTLWSVSDRRRDAGGTHRKRGRRLRPEPGSTGVSLTPAPLHEVEKPDRSALNAPTGVGILPRLERRAAAAGRRGIRGWRPLRIRPRPGRAKEQRCPAPTCNVSSAPRGRAGKSRSRPRVGQRLTRGHGLRPLRRQRLRMTLAA
jgi:hypothetical protein